MTVHVFHRFSDLDFDKLMSVYEKSEYSREYDYLREFFLIPGVGLAVLEETGEYRSALRMEPYKDGMLLTALETMPEYRRQGYGKKLVLAVVDRFDVPVYSHVDKRNKASLALHETCGFGVSKDCATLLDGTVTQQMYTLCRL